MVVNKGIWKALSVVVAVCILALGLHMPVSAGDGYDRNAAIEYASTHWESSARLDCANFVSKCIKAGGSSCSSASSSTLHNLLLESGEGYGFDVAFDGTIYANAYPGMIAPGDVCQFYCSDCNDGKPWVHSTLVAGISDDGYLKCYSHSSSNDGSDIYYYSTSCWYCGGDVSKAWIYHFEDEEYIPNTGNDPIGWLDSLEGSQGGVDITCWGFDWDDTSIPVGFKVYFGGDKNSGAPYRKVDANDDRPDILDYYTVLDTWHGCQAFVEAFESGQQTVYVYVENYGEGEDTLIGCSSVYIEAVDYNAYASSSEISMKVGESRNITLHYPGNGRCSTIYPYNSNESVAQQTFGECTIDHLPVTIKALSAGTTEFKYEFKTSGGQTLRTVIVKVTVTDKPVYNREDDKDKSEEDHKWKRWTDAAFEASQRAAESAKEAYNTGYDMGKKVFEWWSKR